MERSKEFKIAKWLTRKVFMEEGIIIPIGKYFGWRGFDPLTFDEHDLVKKYKNYIDEMLESAVVEIIEGPQNPMGIKKFVDDFADKNGKKEGPEFNRVYIPNDPNLITIIVVDHCGLLRPEKRDGTQYSSKKEIIDLASSDFRRFRDLYGHTVVNVSQFNRDISNPIRLKNGNVSPNLEDFKESGNTQEDFI